MFISRKRYENDIEKAVRKALDEEREREYLVDRIGHVEEDSWKNHRKVMEILRENGLLKDEKEAVVHA